MATTVFLFSCKKNYTCQCHNPSTNEPQTFNILRSKHSDAEKECAKYQDINKYGYDTCKLN